METNVSSSYGNRGFSSHASPVSIKTTLYKRRSTAVGEASNTLKKTDLTATRELQKKKPLPSVPIEPKTDTPTAPSTIRWQSSKKSTPTTPNAPSKVNIGTKPTAQSQRPVSKPKIPPRPATRTSQTQTDVEKGKNENKTEESNETAATEEEKLNRDRRSNTAANINAVANNTIRAHQTKRLSTAQTRPRSNTLTPGANAIKAQIVKKNIPTATAATASRVTQASQTKPKVPPKSATVTPVMRANIQNVKKATSNRVDSVANQSMSKRMSSTPNKSRQSVTPNSLDNNRQASQKNELKASTAASVTVDNKSETSASNIEHTVREMPYHQNVQLSLELMKFMSRHMKLLVEMSKADNADSSATIKAFEGMLSVFQNAKKNTLYEFQTFLVNIPSYSEYSEACIVQEKNLNELIWKMLDFNRNMNLLYTVLSSDAEIFDNNKNKLEKRNFVTKLEIFVKKYENLEKTLSSFLEAIHSEKVTLKESHAFVKSFLMDINDLGFFYINTWGYKPAGIYHKSKEVMVKHFQRNKQSTADTEAINLLIKVTSEFAQYKGFFPILIEKSTFIFEWRKNNKFYYEAEEQLVTMVKDLNTYILKAQGDLNNRLSHIAKENSELSNSGL